MAKSNIVYQVEDRPSWGKTLIFALQQLLAILAATIAVPSIVGNGMSHAAALLGAGVGTLIYLLLTKFKSPVFLGSSFAFIGPMLGAFSGAATMSIGYIGLIIGALLAGLVYVVIAIIVKFLGTSWIDKVMPAVVIGPVVAIIGLSLAGNAVGDLLKGNFFVDTIVEGETVSLMTTNTWIAFACGIVTLFTTIAVSVYGKGFIKMIPFVMGILAGYALASIFTGIGYLANNDALKVINFEVFSDLKWLPEFTFINAFKGFGEIPDAPTFFTYLGTIAVLYVPVAFVVFAEHLADHKNLSSVIDRDLLKEPGLHRTLLGDGIGSAVGAIFGGCPNTTYGESVGTVAISGNASVITIVVTAVMAIVLAFVAPFTTFLATIPSCVMGGVCIALYGFIAVSGLKMLQKVDLNENGNLFTVSTILITGVGGLILNIGAVELRTVACSLILGILVNLLCNFKKRKKEETK